MTATIETIRGASNNGRRESRESLLFRSLQRPGADEVLTEDLVRRLQDSGLELDDPRLAGFAERLSGAGGRGPMDLSEFTELTRDAFPLIEKAAGDELVIREFDAFRSELEELYHRVRPDSSGAVANYIPQLGRVDPDLFGVAACTIDGQRLSLGDTDVPFCMQSTCKPFLYCLALEEHGEDVVHRHIGREPSGKTFNDLALNSDGLPHNPMINAGAIMSSALIRRDLDPADRFDHVLKMLERMGGGVRPGFSNAVYLSERGTADRNFALGYSMREHGAFPDDTDLVETLEFYFQLCSIETTARTFALIASTLANGGICPLTGERIFGMETVRKCLSLMSSCGMYDFSGEWAFAIGLPAKSGVSGAVIVVVPNVMGLCLWSPPLDRNGNSVRAIRFCRELLNRFNFHAFDVLDGGGGKHDPRRARDSASKDLLVELTWAASKGDLDEVQRVVARGADVDGADYDGRTPMHLAASEGHVHVVSWFLEHGARPDSRDRWGNRPIDDARREEHVEVESLLTGTGV